MTQVLLHSGLAMAYLIFIPLEIVILAAEMTAYVFLLRGISKAIRIAYAVVSNGISAAAGFFLTGISDSFINVL